MSLASGEHLGLVEKGQRGWRGNMQSPTINETSSRNLIIVSTELVLITLVLTNSNGIHKQNIFTRTANVGANFADMQR
jgi:hypothetical protein